MKQILLLLTVVITMATQAQPVSQFNWNSNPVSNAAYGPDAVSISSSAFSCNGGSVGTNGLNPGLPKMNIDLVLDGAVFNLSGIDISLNFRREESEASFFKRGSFDFGMSGGALYVNFPLADGASYMIVKSNSIYTMANDHLMHNYRFRYDHVTGKGNVWVDGTMIYTYNGVPNQPLYWTGAGNAVIGTNMDGSGTNVTILDNFIIQNAVNAALPQQLLSFDALQKNNSVELTWITAKEFNVQQYELERSANGVEYKTLTIVKATNAYALTNTYRFADAQPVTGISYYRLRMVDNDGRVTYSGVKMINRKMQQSAVTCYPNPASSQLTIEVPAGYYTYSVYTQSGQLLLNGKEQFNGTQNQIRIRLDSVKSGTLVVKVNEEAFVVVKK